MADLTELQASSVTRIVGGNELHAADVIQEDGQNKLLVKSTTVPEGLGNLVFKKALNGSSSNLAVNGSGSTVTFNVLAESGGGAADIVIQELKFVAFDGDIDYEDFLGLNNPLTNGVLISITSEGSTFSFPAIKSTADFSAHFTYGPGADFGVTFTSPSDFMVAKFSPSNPFILKKDTTDKIQILIRDNLTTVNYFEFISFGFRDV